MLPFDGSVQAEYADGFVLDETELGDISPYEHFNDDGELIPRNILRAIIDKMPEAEHGAMVRYSCFYKDRRYDVNWTTLPDNARPIRFLHLTRREAGGVWLEEPQLVRLDFGFQYTDDNGQNQQEVMELS